MYHIEKTNSSALQDLFTMKFEKTRRSKNKNINCYEVAESKKVIVFGVSIGSGCYCVVNNMCINTNGKFVLFSASAKTGLIEFHENWFDRKPYTKIEPAITSFIFKSDGKIIWEKGTTVLLRHSLCCSHIRHFAEPLPTLLSGLLYLKSNENYNTSVDRIIMFPGHLGDLSVYKKFMLEAVLRYTSSMDNSVYFRKTLNHVVLKKQWYHRRNIHCFIMHKWRIILEMYYIQKSID